MSPWTVTGVTKNRPDSRVAGSDRAGRIGGLYRAQRQAAAGDRIVFMRRSWHGFNWRALRGHRQSATLRLRAAAARVTAATRRHASAFHRIDGSIRPAGDAHARLSRNSISSMPPVRLFDVRKMTSPRLQDWLRDRGANLLDARTARSGRPTPPTPFLGQPRANRPDSCRWCGKGENRVSETVESISDGSDAAQPPWRWMHEAYTGLARGAARARASASPISGHCSS